MGFVVKIGFVPSLPFRILWAKAVG